MKIKLTLCVFLVIGIIGTSFGQKIKLKKNKIIINGNKTFDFKKNNNTGEFSIYELDSKNEIIFIYYNDNETRGFYDDDYVKIQFHSLDLSMESGLALFGKKAVKWFVENELFDEKGKLNEGNIKKFVSKYDEKITERTIRRN